MTIDTLRLTAEEAAGLVERREVTGAELHRAYLDAIAERDGELHAYLRTVDEPAGDGVPIAFKDLITTRGVETQDFLTAEISRVPWDVLKKTGRGILEACPKVAKVFYDLTPKPPATVEFE